MQNFYDNSKQYSKEILKNFLLQNNKPCYESELFKSAAPQLKISDLSSLQLYQNHFILFRILYELQQDFYKENKYLYIHFMRTILVDIPGEDHCRFFNEDLVEYCAAPCHDMYCDKHAGQIKDDTLDITSMRYFYLDKKNYNIFNEETADAFLSGTWHLLKNIDLIKKGYQIMDLPSTADTAMIKKKFRQMAKDCHPDLHPEEKEKFNQLNRAYQLLIQVSASIQSFDQ